MTGVRRLPVFRGTSVPLPIAKSSGVLDWDARATSKLVRYFIETNRFLSNGASSC